MLLCNAFFGGRHARFFPSLVHEPARLVVAASLIDGIRIQSIAMGILAAGILAWSMP